MKGIGIDLKINVLECGAFIDLAAKGETGMYITGWGNATGDTDYNQYNLYHSSSLGAPGNYAFYENPEVDRLIEAGRTEKDVEKRKQIYEKAQEIKVKDAVHIPYRGVENLAAISKNVQGVWISPSGLLQLYDTSIVQ